MKNIECLSISADQKKMVNNHLAMAQEYVVPEMGQQQALINLRNKFELFAPKYADMLIEIVEANLPDVSTVYGESGYDSSQSNRKLSKIVGEIFLIGGLTAEGKLLGLGVDCQSVMTLIKSGLSIPDEYYEAIESLSLEKGGEQDFLFPGVTATDESVDSLEEMIVNTLTGSPMISVRNIAGVGGLRDDKDWNMATDMPSFIDLKVLEDKRYYPGMGVFYWLSAMPLSDIPAIQSIKGSSMYKELEGLKASIEQTKPKTEENISVLCTAYLPSWNEMKQWIPYQDSEFLGDLSSAFHSPSYEFSFLKMLFDNISSGKSPNEAIVKSQIQDLKSKLNYLWSFNSPIHLPWTSELAGLSNNLMGNVTNLSGDYCLRFGLGKGNSSIELREYHYGSGRNTNPVYQGKTAYCMVYYPDSKVFEGKKHWKGIDLSDPFWKNYHSKGLLQTLIEAINYYEQI